MVTIPAWTLPVPSPIALARRVERDARHLVLALSPGLVRRPTPRPRRGVTGAPASLDGASRRPAVSALTTTAR